MSVSIKLLINSWRLRRLLILFLELIIKCTQQKPPITEVIPITIATTTYPGKLGILQNGRICDIRLCLSETVGESFLNFKRSFTKKLDAFIFSEIVLVTINWYQVFVSSILVITRMITDRVGLYSVLLPLLISRI